MGGRARYDRKQLDEFIRFWDDLLQAFPEARAKAVQAMGEEVRDDLHGNIMSADLEADAKGTVISWQELRLGSRGGYAALSPKDGNRVRSKDRQLSWRKRILKRFKEKPVSKRRVTRWLEKGHGVYDGDPTKDYRWSDRYDRAGKARINDRTGKRYVPGRQFYSFTRLYAVDHALAAAEKVLTVISDEVDY